MAKRSHPPKTPCERLLQAEAIPMTAKSKLSEIAADLDPLKLLEEMRAVQAYLAAPADGETPPPATSEPPNLATLIASLSSAWRAGEIRPTVSKPNRVICAAMQKPELLLRPKSQMRPGQAPRHGTGSPRKGRITKFLSSGGRRTANEPWVNLNKARAYSARRRGGRHRRHSFLCRMGHGSQPINARRTGGSAHRSSRAAKPKVPHEINSAWPWCRSMRRA